MKNRWQENLHGICSNDGHSRRTFIKYAGVGTALSLVAPWKAIAGPFTRADFESLVPADKKLSQEWIKSLFEKGQREVYGKAELEKIGMPIGGLCTGQLYLGGDGKLWHWDIFNRHIGTGAEHYARPLKPSSPLDQGFAIWISTARGAEVRRLDNTGWKEITFIGEYPIGYVEYKDPETPVMVRLEAFSPFIPLNPEDSSIPATLMQYTIKNGGQEKVEVEMAGWLQNAVCLYSGKERDGSRRNRIVRRRGLLFLECSAEPPPPGSVSATRPDIVFEDFEKEDYSGWTVEGTAFGKGPVSKAQVPEYQGELGMQGNRAVNSHASAPGQDVSARDNAVGTLTSKQFVIQRHYITFLIGGGAHKGKTCINLLVNDKVVLSATGANDNRMKPQTWDVRQWEGQTAKLQIVDAQAGTWGNIGVDDIVFSDRPRKPATALERETDFGTMGLALLEPLDGDEGIAALLEDGVPSGLFSKPAGTVNLPATKPFDQKLIGGLRRKLSLGPGESAVVRFAVVWHFPNLKIDERFKLVGRNYATRFASALAVAEYLAGQLERLCAQTRLWHDTWYDSTLPWWFLNRTFLNTSTLATSTCYLMADGRFYAWEGVGCCAGTCGHVWQYAHAMARLFPQWERVVRERVDFGLAQRADGAIHFRGEFNNFPAVDGQAGTILRALREHQHSPDSAFLKRVWPGVKKAIEYLIRQDGDGDGLITNGQHNTLDTDWYGPVAWLSGLYVAALRAGEVMAQEMGDESFAKQCREIWMRGQKNLVEQLFDQEYFINKPDPKHLDAINSGTGCHIDQVMGQSWAFQIGLGRVLPEKETRSALKSLWRYNFTPDVGPYRERYKPGRWYAMPGEGGLLMCTFPRTDWDYDKARGKGADWAAGYFNECMNGFEYQVASHMIWEGMLMEGLAITRMIHDRYHPLRRNPYNEVECGDHYARSMASYGVFLAACGYQYHGPSGKLGFAPRLQPENFRAAFTTAEGWGTYSQKIENGRLAASLELKWGRLRLTSLGLEFKENQMPSAQCELDGKAVPVRLVRQEQGGILLMFRDALGLQAGSRLVVKIG